jgi:hypothetical protein
VLEEQDARRLAEAYLAETASEALAILAVDEYDVGWVYFWNTRRYQRSLDRWDGLVGNAPFLIDRVDGSMHHIGAGDDISDFVQRHREGGSQNESMTTQEVQRIRRIEQAALARSRIRPDPPTL